MLKILRALFNNWPLYDAISKLLRLYVRRQLLQVAKEARGSCYLHELVMGQSLCKIM